MLRDLFSNLVNYCVLRLVCSNCVLNGSHRFLFDYLMYLLFALRQDMIKEQKNFYHLYKNILIKTDAFRLKHLQGTNLKRKNIQHY